MSEQHDWDRIFLQEIRSLDTNQLLVMLHFECERWKKIAIDRELDRRERLAQSVLKGNV